MTCSRLPVFKTPFPDPPRRCSVLLPPARVPSLTGEGDGALLGVGLRRTLCISGGMIPLADPVRDTSAERVLHETVIRRGVP